jgi:hypothetical protein
MGWPTEDLPGEMREFGASGLPPIAPIANSALRKSWRRWPRSTNGPIDRLLDLEQMLRRQRH